MPEPAPEGPVEPPSDDRRRTDVSRLFGQGPRNAQVPAWLRKGSHALAEEVARAGSSGRHVDGELRAGERVGPWRIDHTLGAGGQSIVYLAFHTGTRARAALKIPRSEVAPRLMREARILERLQHGRIVRLIDASFDGPIPYLAMEDLACGSMADGIAILRARPKGNHYSPERLFAIAAGVLEALQFAHEQGVVHRDVKPANILFDGEGRVKVGDFGIGAISLAAAARAAGDGDADGSDGKRSSGADRDSCPGGGNPLPALPAEGSSLAQSLSPSAAGLPGGGATLFVGTPAYMAPEQEDPRKAQNGRVDGRADLFSLGKSLYEAITLRSPRTIRPIRVDRPDLPAEWDDLILRLVEERPEDRPQSAAAAREMIVALARRSGHPWAALPGAAIPYAGPMHYPLDATSRSIAAPHLASGPPWPPAGPPPGPPPGPPSMATDEESLAALAALTHEVDATRRRAQEEIRLTDADAYSKGYQDALAAAARARSEAAAAEAEAARLLVRAEERSDERAAEEALAEEALAEANRREEMEAQRADAERFHEEVEREMAISTSRARAEGKAAEARAIARLAALRQRGPDSPSLAWIAMVVLSALSLLGTVVGSYEALRFYGDGLTGFWPLEIMGSPQVYQPLLVSVISGLFPLLAAARHLSLISQGRSDPRPPGPGAQPAGPTAPPPSDAPAPTTPRHPIAPPSKEAIEARKDAQERVMAGVRGR